MRFQYENSKNFRTFLENKLFLIYLLKHSSNEIEEHFIEKQTISHMNYKNDSRRNVPSIELCMIDEIYVTTFLVSLIKDKNV